MTAVERTTRCIVGWRIEPTRVFEILQSVVDQAVRAQHYFSDGFRAMPMCIITMPNSAITSPVCIGVRVAIPNA